MTGPASGLRIGLAVPQFGEGPSSVAAIRRFVERAEQAPIDSLWTLERVTGTVPAYEPLSLLSFVAAQSRRLRLGVSVVLPALRNPLVLARSLASIDHLSGGRLEAGFGVGDDPPFAASGLAPAKAGERFAESVSLLLRLWSEERVDFAGRYFTLEGVSVRPSPLQRPHPPVWFGAKSDVGLRRTIAMADGWMGAGAVSSADFARQASRLRELLAGAPPPMVGKRAYTMVARTRREAASVLGPWFESFYGDASMHERVAVVGSASDVAEQLGTLRESGAELLVINPVADEERQLEAIVEHVLPALSEPRG